jgi:hypothetical protein
MRQIAALVAATFPVAQELRPGLVRLADKDDIGKPIERLFLDRRQWSSDHGHDTERPHPFQDLAHPPALDAHPREAHEVSPRQARKIDILDVFVDQRYVVMIGNKRCKQGEACDRKVRALPQQADAVLHAPKGDVETGINDNDVGHDRLPAQA